MRMRSPKLLSTSPKPRLRHLAPPSFVAVALLVAACGSSSGSGSGSSNATPKPQTSNPPAKTSAKPAVTVTKVSGYGKVLGNAKGQPLFLLTADPTGSSKCTGKCATDWPPLLAKTGTPTAGAGVKASLLSTFKRSDGTRQVLYNGHALYTHPGASPTAVAGSATDGGVWYLVSPSGSAVTKTSGGGY